jgi:hypothetical protein
MRFQPTYTLGGGARSLWIAGDNRRGEPVSIQMTDMAYTRPVLADVAKTLLHANPRVKIDGNVRALIDSA